MRRAVGGATSAAAHAAKASKRSIIVAMLCYRSQQGVACCASDTKRGTPVSTAILRAAGAAILALPKFASVLRPLAHDDAAEPSRWATLSPRSIYFFIFTRGEDEGTSDISVRIGWISHILSPGSLSRRDTVPATGVRMSTEALWVSRGSFLLFGYAV